MDPRGFIQDVEVRHHSWGMMDGTKAAEHLAGKKDGSWLLRVSELVEELFMRQFSLQTAISITILFHQIGSGPI